MWIRIKKKKSYSCQFMGKWIFASFQKNAFLNLAICRSPIPASEYLQKNTSLTSSNKGSIILQKGTHGRNFSAEKVMC